jgi:hypothetical protein
MAWRSLREIKGRYARVDLFESEDMYYTFPAFAKAAVLKKKAQATASAPSEAKKEVGEAATRSVPENNPASGASKVSDE